MNILLTGGSSGIGADLFYKFSNDSNHKILSFGRTKLDHFAHQNSKYLILDLEHYKVKASEFKESINTFFCGETIDIVILNAGILISKSFENITTFDLEQIFQINFFANFQILQDLKPFLTKNKDTHVVCIGSMGGFQGSVKFSGLSAYSASKAALASLTESLAEEWKDENIKINCLALGAVDTFMLQKAFPEYKANLTAFDMALFIADFALNGQRFFNGKIIPVSLSTP